MTAFDFIVDIGECSGQFADKIGEQTHQSNQNTDNENDVNNSKTSAVSSAQHNARNSN